MALFYEFKKGNDDENKPIWRGDTPEDEEEAKRRNKEEEGIRKMKDLMARFEQQYENENLVEKKDISSKKEIDKLMENGRLYDFLRKRESEIKPQRLISKQEADELRLELEYDAKKYIGERLFETYELMENGNKKEGLRILEDLEPRVKRICDGDFYLAKQTLENIKLLRLVCN
jgi:hypothetical protein